MRYCIKGVGTGTSRRVALLSAFDPAESKNLVIVDCFIVGGVESTFLDFFDDLGFRDFGDPLRLLPDRRSNPELIGFSYCLLKCEKNMGSLIWLTKSNERMIILDEIRSKREIYVFILLSHSRWIEIWENEKTVEKLTIRWSFGCEEDVFVLIVVFFSNRR